MAHNNKQNKVLVSGRAGELTEYANPLTFSLLEKIFGYGGPYRHGLDKFGVFCKNTSDSFLENVKGKVYSDLNKENEIIWSNYPFLLKLNNNRIVTSANWFPSPVKKCYFFLRKLFTETRLFINLKQTEATADNVYTTFCSAVDRTFEIRSISESKFLGLYMHVVHATYLYELFYNYNTGVKHHTLTDDNYTKDNDYLLKYDTDYIEFRLKLDNGFYLDYYPEISRKLEIPVGSLKHIPPVLPKIGQDKLNTFSLEAKLQCIKNNMRLKTNLMLFFLNRNLQEKALGHNIKEFGYLTLEELAGLEPTTTNKHPDPNLLIPERKEGFSLDEASKLPSILIR